MAAAWGSNSGFSSLMVLIGALLTAATPKFLTAGNLIVIVARQISLNGILAVGVTFVLLTGGVDLSLGSVVALAGVVAAGFAPSRRLLASSAHVAHVKSWPERPQARPMVFSSLAAT